MLKSLALTLVVLLVLAVAPAAAQCDAAWVLARIQGTWRINQGSQARADLFGGVFASGPQVQIAAGGKGALTFNGGDAYRIGSFAPEPNPQGGTWCGFTIGAEPARLIYASNKWWILEIGRSNDRNRLVELIRR